MCCSIDRDGDVNDGKAPSKADIKRGYENLKIAFRKFDTDNSGHLDPAEFVQIMSRVVGGGHPMPQEEAEDFIAAFDMDADGKLNIDEFCKVRAVAMPPSCTLL